jgi:hypothetical protein
MQRRNLVKRTKRRDKILNGLVRPMSMLLTGIGEPTGEQTVQLSFGYGKKLQQVVDDINSNPIWHSAFWPPPQPPFVPDEKLLSVPRPTRTLRTSKNGSLLCRFTSPRIILWEKPEGSKEICDFFRNEDTVRRLRSVCRFRVFELGQKLLYFSEPRSVASYLN